MKIMRLATVDYENLESKVRSVIMQVGPVEVRIADWLDTPKGVKPLVYAQIEWNDGFSLDNDGFVIIPDALRSQAERAIEVMANVIAVGQRERRSISSPMPYSALPES